jgi:hypothetical protein
MTPRRLSLFACVTLGAWLSAGLVACGGGGNPLGNPPDVQNPEGTTGQKLAFAYFQKCIQPLLVQPITSPGGAVNTCATGGCHSSVNGTGGALRIVDGASLIDLGDPANTPDLIRASDMYKNYYSSLGVTVPGSADESRLLNKPLVRGVLHGGGQILANDQDPVARLISYWIAHPAPEGQDEFSPATYSMFTPADPNTGTCNTP